MLVRRRLIMIEYIQLLIDLCDLKADSRNKEARCFPKSINQTLSLIAREARCLVSYERGQMPHEVITEARCLMRGVVSVCVSME
jgi:hypothetical protein